MVYCGKPSTACGECRQRRTKCDNKRPSCSQCVRAGRVCKGYRDPSDLMFRDELAGINARRQRARDAHAPRPRANDTRSKPAGNSQALIMPFSDTSFMELRPTPVFSITLGTSAEEQATCFFFQNYVIAQDGFPRGSFQYLSDVYGSEEIRSALADSVACLGLVGLANFWGASNIMVKANIKYNSALRTISSQLRNIDEAKSDQTIISIMLLGLYETNTCNSRKSLETWTKHINGASALLQLRGKEQLRTPIGYQLFVHLRTQLLTNCIQRHVTVPPIIGDWSKELDFETIEQAATTSLCELATKFCNLRASMSEFHDYSDPERIITAACAIDAEYANWAKTCPLEYIYQTVTLKERHDEVFSDHYHVYSTIWVATIWNHYRAIRILVNELILDQLGHLYQTDPSSSLLWNDSRFFESQILTSNTTLLQLCHDICSSVPYYLGFNPDSNPGSTPRPPKAVHGNLLLWPLYTAGVTAMVSDMMRNWIAGRLQWISDVMGIRQASPMVLSMAKKQDLLTWEPEPESESVVVSPDSEFTSYDTGVELIDMENIMV